MVESPPVEKPPSVEPALPLGVSSTLGPTRYAFEGRPTRAVAAPAELEDALGSAVGIVAAVVFTILCLGLLFGGMFTLRDWLVDLTGWAWLAVLVEGLGYLIAPIALIGAPFMGSEVAKRLLNAVRPRGKVATLAYDENRVVLAMPAPFSTGLAQEVLDLEQSGLVVRDVGEDTVTLKGGGHTLEIPRFWSKARITPGELGRHPRARGTHELVVDEGRVRLRFRDKNQERADMMARMGVKVVEIDTRK